MSSAQNVENSSPCGEVDERKRKRMISNRESARRSRMRKQQHLDDLIKRKTELESQRFGIKQRIALCQKLWEATVSENKALEALKAELSRELEILSDFEAIETFEMKNLSGNRLLLKPPMDVSGSRDAVLQPWQLRRTSQPIAANVFQF